MAASKRSAAAGRKKATVRKATRRPTVSTPDGNDERPAEGAATPIGGRRAETRATDAASRSAGRAATAALDASRKAMKASPAIVLRAAAIIEEEVASGIGAARRIEQRFLDVDALRAQHPDRVMSRFRKDAHEAVDILLDIVTAAATTVGEQAGRMVNVTASHMPRAGAQGNGSATDGGGLRLSTVRMPGTVSPGQKGELTISLENESDTATTEFTLHSSELVSASGDRIPADHVAFTPATLSVAPRATGMVKVQVRVPKTVGPGSYEGLLRATQLDGLRAMLTVQVS